MPKSNKKRERTNKPISRKQRNTGKTVTTTTKIEEGKEDSMDKSILTAVLKEYSKNANVEKAAQMKKYMRGQFEFFGIQAPLQRRIHASVNNFYPRNWWLARVTLVVGLVFLPQNFGPVVGTYECRWGGNFTWRWWGRLNTTLCN